MIAQLTVPTISSPTVMRIIAEQQVAAVPGIVRVIALEKVFGILNVGAGAVLRVSDALDRVTCRTVELPTELELGSS